MKKHPLLSNLLLYPVFKADYQNIYLIRINSISEYLSLTLVIIGRHSVSGLCRVDEREGWG